MNDMSRPPYIQPASPMQRTAEALADLQQLHADHDLLLRKGEEQRRTIERQEDRISMIMQDLRASQQTERVVTRKLIRLATELSNMGTMARNAEEIMHSIKEWQDETPEETAAEEESARRIVASLPAAEVQPS